MIAKFSAFLLWSAMGAVFTVLLACALPIVAHGRSFVVLSGSMSPNINTGDVVVALPEKPAEARVGTVVAFHNPEQDGRLTSHRVQSIERRGKDFHFVTRGDANTSTESWNVEKSGTIGRIVYRVPSIGYALIWLESVWVRTALVVACALFAFVLALKRIWKPEKETA